MKLKQRVRFRKWEYKNITIFAISSHQDTYHSGSKFSKDSADETILKMVIEHQISLTWNPYGKFLKNSYKIKN